MSANASINITVVASDTKAAALASYGGSPTISFTKTLSTSDISKCYQNNQTSASPITFDVNSGLTDAYGTALVYTSVKTIVVRNNAASASLVIGGGSNPLMGTDQVTLAAGQVLVLTSPITVDGTHKVLTITPSASASVDVLILGS